MSYKASGWRPRCNDLQEAAMDDLISTLHRMQNNFEGLGLEPDEMPVLQLPSRMAGYRLTMALALRMGQAPIMFSCDEDGRCWSVLQIAGVKVRWP